MTSAEFLQNFMPGDVVTEVRATPEKETQIVIVFASGYELVTGEGWHWRASEELKAQEAERARRELVEWQRQHPGEERPIQ